MTRYSDALLAASASFLMLTAGVPAMAECMTEQRQTTAQQKSAETVAQAKTDPQTGETEAATGGAKPVENWFGCKPGNKDDANCVSQKGKEQEQKAKDSADAGKAAEKPADPSTEATSRTAPTGTGNATTAGSTSVDGSADTATAAKTGSADGGCAEDRKPS